MKASSLHMSLADWKIEVPLAQSSTSAHLGSHVLAGRLLHPLICDQQRFYLSQL